MSRWKIVAAVVSFAALNFASGYTIGSVVLHVPDDKRSAPASQSAPAAPPALASSPPPAPASAPREARLWKDELPIAAPASDEWQRKAQDREVPFNVDRGMLAVLRAVPYPEYAALIGKLRELKAGCAAAAGAAHRGGFETFEVWDGKAYCYDTETDDKGFVMEGRRFWSTDVKLSAGVVR